MESIRRIMYSASNSGAFNLRAFWILHALELKILIASFVLGLGLMNFGDSTSLVKELAFVETSLVTQIPQSLKESEKIDVKDLVAKSMSYSYADTQLGFYLDNLTFFNKVSKTDAEEAILSSVPTSMSKNAEKYVRAVLKIAEKHQVDPIWVLSVMWTESHFQYSAKSWAGARGLMQIMPETRKYIYKKYRRAGNTLLVEQDEFNIHAYFPYNVPKAAQKVHLKKLVNIELGVIYLKGLLSSFKSHKYATVAYNMGPGWTRFRLRKNLPVGSKNEYLDKVERAYKRIVTKI